MFLERHINKYFDHFWQQHTLITKEREKTLPLDWKSIKLALIFIFLPGNIGSTFKDVKCFAANEDSWHARYQCSRMFWQSTYCNIENWLFSEWAIVGCSEMTRKLWLINLGFVYHESGNEITLHIHNWSLETTNLCFPFYFNFSFLNLNIVSHSVLVLFMGQI